MDRSRGEPLGTTGQRLSAKTIAKKRAQLDRYLLPALGALTVSKIAPPDVWPLLKAIESRGNHETAHRVRQMASEIFPLAVTTSRASSDPAALLGDALKPVQTRNHPSLIDPVAVGALLTAIDQADGSPFIVAALQLAPLVFVRPGELRNAAWTEIDLDRRDLAHPGAPDETVEGCASITWCRSPRRPRPSCAI